MHDPLAVAVALDPSLVETEAVPVDVETRGEITRGQTLADFRGSPGRLGVAVEVDAPRFRAGLPRRDRAAGGSGREREIAREVAVEQIRPASRARGGETRFFDSMNISGAMGVSRSNSVSACSQSRRARAFASRSSPARAMSAS